MSNFAGGTKGRHTAGSSVPLRESQVPIDGEIFGGSFEQLLPLAYRVDAVDASETMRRQRRRLRGFNLRWIRDIFNVC